MKGVKLTSDLIDAKTGKVVAEAGTKMTPRAGQEDERRRAEAGPRRRRTTWSAQYLAPDIIDEKTGEILLEAGDELTQACSTRSRRPASTNCRRWPSTTSMSAPTSAIPWPIDKNPAAKRR